MSFKLHHEMQVHDFLVSDATTRDGSRRIWIGHGGINGRWVNATEAHEVAAAIEKIATAHTEGTGPAQQGGAA